MKNYLLIAVALLLLSACNQNQTNAGANGKDTSQVTADTVTYTMKSFFKTSDECKTDTCAAYVAAKYPVFVKNNDLNDFVLEITTPAPFKEDPTESIEVSADSFINEYINYRKEFPDSPAGYHWDQTLIVTQQDKDVISFKHVNYAYTGGAHGMQTTLFHNLYQSGYKKISLKDILNRNYDAELTKIGEAIFRKNEGLKATDPLDGYFFENQQFVLNDNFLITPKGLLFLYNQYEIKAYAFGTTELLIPYTAIKHLIAADGVLAKYK
jgi:hypothetical protein